MKNKMFRTMLTNSGVDGWSIVNDSPTVTQLQTTPSVNRLFRASRRINISYLAYFTISLLKYHTTIRKIFL